MAIPKPSTISTIGHSHKKDPNYSPMAPPPMVSSPPKGPSSPFLPPLMTPSPMDLPSPMDPFPPVIYASSIKPTPMHFIEFPLPNFPFYHDLSSIPTIYVVEIK